MKAASVAVRILISLACVFVLWRVAIQELADYYASSRTADAYQRAVRIQPGNAEFVSARAVFLAVNGDPSTAVDQALQAAVSMNPADAEALMALGLRAENRGDLAAARTFLERAASASRLFKPAWTLANFYFRTGEDARFWPMIERCLTMIEPRNLEPMSFDPSPIFDLAWHQEANPAKIRAIVPKRAATIIPYLRYLYFTDRFRAALDVWPDALAAANPGVPQDFEAILLFSEYLIYQNYATEAVAVWNDSIKRGFVQSTPLDPATGNFVENPEFVYPAIAHSFSWFPAHLPGVFVTEAPHAMRFEFTGNEPENFELLWKFLPLGSGRNFRLTWDADASRLEKPPGAPSGLAFTLDELPAGGQAGHPCAPFASEGKGACELSVLPATRVLRLSLRYQRPIGATRLKGVFVLSAAHLEPAR